VEGFFDLCDARGLTGQQGVMLPAANVNHLMLREDVVEAIAAGRFHIWAVSTIDEGIELLTGVKAGKRDRKGQFPPDSVHGKAEARLKQIAELLDKSSKPPAAETTGETKANDLNDDKADRSTRRSGRGERGKSD
jgi:predicted ATP-dependent protease